MNRREFIKDLGLIAIPFTIPDSICNRISNSAEEIDSLETLVQSLSNEAQLLSSGLTSDDIKACFNDARFNISDKVVKEFEKAAKPRTGAGAFKYEGYYTKKGEYVKGWRDIHGIEWKINNGPDFYAKYKDDLEGAEKKYGVDSRYIAAVIGVETNYGNFTGDFPTFNSLATIYVKTPTRKTEEEKQKMRAWAYKELIELFKFAGKNSKSVYEYKGSYAGAIGKGQYVPSSLNAYFVGQKGNFEANPSDMTDTIYSVAYYLHKHGWDNSQIDPPPEENSKNWNVIHSYNHDPYYVRGVSEVAAKANWLSKISKKTTV